MDVVEVLISVGIVAVSFSDFIYKSHYLLLLLLLLLLFRDMI